jgi:hypothetical protein
MYSTPIVPSRRIGHFVQCRFSSKAIWNTSAIILEAKMEIVQQIVGENLLGDGRFGIFNLGMKYRQTTGTAST